MPLGEEWLVSVAQAAGLGLGVALILWLFRNYAPVRRVRASILLAAFMGGLYLVLRGSGIPDESSALKVVAAAGILSGANAVLQLFDLFLWDYLISRRRHVDVPRLLVDLFNFVALVAVALVVLSQVFGVKDLSALLVTSTVVSAVIGLSLQDLLGNVIAGIALQLERPFAVGDWVQVSEQEGQVVQMNWRTLTLRTRDNHNVFLPNANAARQDIVNYSRPTPLQMLHAEVGVAYRHAPGEVKAVLARAVAGAEGVRADPPPEILVKDYGEYAVHYDVRYWIADFARAPQIRDAVLTRLWYALRRAGMTIPFPIRDVNVRTLPEDHEARAQELLRREVFAALRPLSVFAPLSDPQIEQLGRGAALERYTAGEVLVRQGEPGDSLFVIKAGQVRVDVRNENGQVATVAALGPDDFFGEMSLLTGEPRSASVVAETEVEVVVVDKPDLAAVITADNRVPEALSVALEARLRSAAERAAAGPVAPADRSPLQRIALLDRIRQFFGIRSL
jgi:small-conductance mechanosensitive channel/CRP-like cAMP-binding protein